MILIMSRDATSSPPTAGVDLPTREGYDRWAAFYDVDENPLVALEQPWVDRLLGEVRGLSLLEVGCGTGRHAIRLASHGAVVHALDFSPEMLEQARQKPGNEHVRFQLHDLSLPLPFSNQAFDRVLCALVLDHISDLDSLFREMRRVCRPSGRVVITAMHPAMMLRGVQARFRDPQSGEEVRPASVPNQLSDYVMAAARAGFSFEHMSEHAVDEALTSRLERARRYLGWPMLFLMALRPASLPNGLAL
jgi:ubiquinone/menaquinone biosynthesis C-methylase UbiE